MTDVSRRQLLAGAAGLAAVGGLAAACGSGSSSSSTSSSSTAAAGTPKRGGNFRLGVTGGGSKDIMDGQNIITKPDQARLVTAFETLLLFDENYQLTTNGLAESVTQDNPKQYTIKLRQGIEFQNGKTLTADDVIYSFQRIGTKTYGLTGYAATATMDIAGDEEAGQVHGAAPAEDPGLHGPADPRQLYLHHRARRVQGVPGTRRSAPAPTSSSRSRPASRASTSATRTTGAAASRTSTR